MLFRKILVVILISLAAYACSSSGTKSEADNNKGSYVAIVDSSMTLAEVAKANKIGEPYLRTKLGIKKGVGNTYTVVRMGKLFDFTINDLKTVIEEQKNNDSGFSIQLETSEE